MIRFPINFRTLLRMFAATFVLFVLHIPGASALETRVVARSGSLGIVFITRSEHRCYNWTHDPLTLSVHSYAENGAVFRTNEFTDLVKRLAAILEHDCRTLEVLNILGRVKGSTESSYSIIAAKKWNWRQKPAPTTRYSRTQCDTFATYRYDFNRKADNFHSIEEIPPEAEGYCRNAVKRLPNAPRQHFQLGRTLLSKKDYNGAISSFKKTLALDPIYRAAYNGLGHIYALQGRCDSGFELLDEALRLGFYPAHITMGHIYASDTCGAPKYGKALEHFRKAAATEYRLPDAQSYIGWMYEHGHGVNKDLDRAMGWYSKAERQGNKYAKEALSRIRKTIADLREKERQRFLESVTGSKGNFSCPEWDRITYCFSHWLIDMWETSCDKLGRQQWTWQPCYGAHGYCDMETGTVYSSESAAIHAVCR